MMLYEYHTGIWLTETAGPAHSFLVNANHPLRSLVLKEDINSILRDGGL